MNRRTRILLFACFIAFPCGFAPTRGQAAEGDGLLDEVRAAMAERELTVAKAKLEEAARLDGDEAFTSERKRLTLLHAYLEDFWKSVDDGAKSLQAVEELKIGDVLVSVVEYQPGLLVLRVKGENKRYTVKTLPAKVALTLAERVLKPDDPQNKVFFGTFLLMDGKGDREIARKLWTEAQKADVDVASLLPELGNCARRHSAGRDSAAALCFHKPNRALHDSLSFFGKTGCTANAGRNALENCNTTRHRYFTSADPSRRPGLGLAGWFLGGWRQHDTQVVVRTWNHLDADDFANAARGVCAGVGGRFDGRHVSRHKGRYQATADFVPAEKLHVRGLQHGVGGLNQSDKALGLDHSQRFHCLCHIGLRS